MSLNGAGGCDDNGFVRCGYPSPSEFSNSSYSAVPSLLRTSWIDSGAAAAGLVTSASASGPNFKTPSIEAGIGLGAGVKSIPGGNIADLALEFYWPQGTEMVRPALAM